LTPITDITRIELQRSGVGAEPRRQILAPGRLDVQIAAGAQHLSYLEFRIGLEQPS